MIKKAYVVGESVKHSLSPTIFNYWFKKNNIKAVYKYKQIKPQNYLHEINKIMNQKNVCGFNITIPFKEIFLPKITTYDSHSKKIGAINCVSKKNNAWEAANTDWIGFAESLKKQKNTNPKNLAIVLGYGGAAKATVYALLKEGYKEIKIFNRTKKKIIDFGFKHQTSLHQLRELPKYIKRADLLVNTIPTNILDKPLVNSVTDKLIVSDIVYKPKHTEFLKKFKNQKKMYGIYMLVYQAAPCFIKWFEQKPIIDEGLFKLLDEHTK